ncbi:15660_t:CDS:2 [Cetraspora pellucida]|uniref:15660_t:CDS:1 n=1 Tax=Cetraspora pellucida TaxID=1433469 RepID=A0ACA9KQ51_9GLOM|nr:15660_t:CDS:2 [Cetraspora pellucida]
MTKAAILPTTHPIPYTKHRRNSFVEVSDYILRTRRFRILGSALGLFLCSLWVVAHFSDASFNIHTLQRYKNIEAAMVAASVMGDGGEEGIHSLEVQSHSRLSVYGHGYRHNVYEQSHPSNSATSHVWETECLLRCVRFLVVRWKYLNDIPVKYNSQGNKTLRFAHVELENLD